MLRHDDGRPDGVRAGLVFGTHWHGAFQSDEFRRSFLTDIAGRPGLRVASDARFGGARERMLDLLGDLVEELRDAAALWLLNEGGVSPDLPTLRLRADHPGWAASCARTVNRPPTV